MVFKKKHIIFSLYVFACFYGTNWVAHCFLPKWIDLLVGLPASMFLIYKGIIFYLNRYG